MNETQENNLNEVDSNSETMKSVESNVNEEKIESPIENQMISEELETQIENQNISEELETTIENQNISEELEPFIENQKDSEEIESSIESQKISEVIEPLIDNQVILEELETPIESQKISEEVEPSIENQNISEELETPIESQKISEEIEPLVENQVILEEIEHSELIDDEKELEVIEEFQDFSGFSKEELLQAALTAANEKPLNEAIQMCKLIRPLIEQLVIEEQNVALHQYIEEGGDKDSFEFKGDQSRDKFFDAYKELRHKQSEVWAEREKEKLNNLKRKEEILAEIKSLTEKEETEGSLKRLKELQTEWKKIKHVPADHVERLWESYRVHIEMFYDRLSIFNELKDLDRSKNLDQKIDLIAKVNELLNETSLKKAFIAVKKYQDEWRHIGPVAKDASDEIWNRFKAEVDKVYEFLRAKKAEFDEVRDKNLALKQDLLVKANELASFQTTKVKEWLTNTNVANELMEEWRKIGQVPAAISDKIWDDFRNARNSFFNNKNTFFKNLHAERKANLSKKEALCKRAEEIATNPIDLAKQTEELKKLQQDWKKIGAVSDNLSDVVWKRFRTACDMFFEKKSEFYTVQIEEQKQNLEQKNNILAKLEALITAETGDNVISELRAIQEEWSAIGFVPVAQKDSVNKKYNEFLDKLYSKHRNLSKEIKEDRERHHFESIAHSSNGGNKIHREEKIMLERIRGLKADIDTWDNNLGFFGNSNKGTSNPLKQQIESKIEIAKKHLKGLEEKLKMLRDIKNNNSTQG